MQAHQRIQLKTERLVLRRLTEADVDHLAELDGDPEVMRYLTGGRPVPRAVVRDEVLPRMLRYYERYADFGFWAAEDQATGAFLGWFHFRPPAGSGIDTVELGYRLRRAAWGRGHATEGSLALIRKGFTELGVQRVTARALAANHASRRVLEKAGLRLVGTAPEEWTDSTGATRRGEVAEYALHRNDWTP